MSQVSKKAELSSGKAKTIYATDDPERLVLLFRDDTSAFDGAKTEKLQDKGRVNNLFNAFIMEKLEAAGIPTHFEKVLSDNEVLVKHLDMLPVEFVVRNIAAGSLCKRLGIESGKELQPPVFELFYKNDELHDPMINESHVISFGWGRAEQLERGRELTLQVNEVLKTLFLEGNMLLVDYKLEFGMHQGQLTLGDEFTPDGCRLWDVETREILDKDRFRQDLGDVVEAYKVAARRLGLEV